MYDDYAIEWLIIEHQLSEAMDYDIEDELFNEGIVTRGILTAGKVGASVPGHIVTKGIVNAGKIAYGGPLLYGGKYVAHSMKNYHPIQGMKNMGQFAGNLARSPMMRASFWGRLLNKLKELWQRFKNIISSLFKTNNSFVNSELTNVEAVIHKAMSNNASANKLYQMTFRDVYPYWLRQDVITQVTVPPFNINDTNMIQSLSDKNTFVNRYIRPLSRIDFNNPECTDNVKALFRGTNQATNIRFDQVAPHIKQISDTCKNTTAYVNRLQQEHRQNEQAANEAMRKLEQMETFQNQNNEVQAQDTAQTIMAIRNYISISQLIVGCKETIIQERYMQSVAIMRQILFQCKAVASKEEVANMEVANNTQVSDPLEGKSAVSRAIKKMRDPEGTKKEIQVSDEYRANLPTDKVQLQKEMLKIKANIDALKKDVGSLSSRLPKNQQERQYKLDQIDKFERRLAILAQQYNS